MLFVTFPYELNNKMMQTILLKHWALTQNLFYWKKIWDNYLVFLYSV